MTSNPENERILKLKKKIDLKDDETPSMQEITTKFVLVVLFICGVMGIVWGWLV